MARFFDVEPTDTNYWRAIILFGKNTATYKFALAKALFDVHRENKTSVGLEDLAVPYLRHLCEHLKKHPKQATSAQNSYLDSLNNFNNGIISLDEAIANTLKLGFKYVFDAFHNVHGSEVNVRFFIDDRKSDKRIHLSDNFVSLGEQSDFLDLEYEVDARWRLVESAWENKIARNLMLVEYQDKGQLLIGKNSIRRTNITSARPALNGYQKGKCFYCFKEISIIAGAEHLADVDHFFPHILRQCDTEKPVNGVSNLVLSCSECNRGEEGKFDKIPSTKLLERLFDRNEYLICSHHPLRETLIAQTGSTQAKRQNYLQEVYSCASTYLGSGKNKWQPKARGSAIF